MTPASRWLPALLGGLTAVGPLSIDIYLPAFPAIEATYGEPPGTAQVTLAAFFAGLAVGQLVQGSLADRYGRRAPLLAALVVYTVASAGCALAPDVVTLSAMRALQAFGGSASMVIPRAIVRDLAVGHEAARLMSRLMLVMGVAPIVAPSIGSAILAVGSWHLIFWADVVYGLICLAAVWVWLPETQAPNRRAHLGVIGLVGRYVEVMRDRGFVVYTLLGGFAMFGLFAFIAGSPPALIGLYGLGPLAYGLMFGLASCGFIVGAQINPLAVFRLGTESVLRYSVRMYLGAALVLAGFAFAGGFGAWTVVVPVMAALCCLGMVVPNAAIGALSGHGAQAGSASAVMGTIQFAMAAVSGTVVGWLTDETARPLAGLMVLGAGSAVLADLLRPPIQRTP